jgi:hypothetical protein
MPARRTVVQPPTPQLRAVQGSPHALLALQRSAGNRAVAQLVQRQEAPGRAEGIGEAVAGAVESGVDTVSGMGNAALRGGEMLWEVDDEGAYFARELIAWRAVGMGKDFVTSEDDYYWNVFMRDRPEIQRAMLPVLEDIALEAAGGGATEQRLLWDETRTYHRSITDVKLNELESMRLTLHGCHRIDVAATVYVTQADNGDVTVEFARIVMTWVDVADLHPGTLTELESGEMVDDSEFTAAGWDYNIALTFAPSENSTFRISGGAVTHESGWPDVDGAPPQPGFRG